MGTIAASLKSGSISGSGPGREAQVAAATGSIKGSRSGVRITTGADVKTAAARGAVMRNNSPVTIRPIVSNSVASVAIRYDRQLLRIGRGVGEGGPGNDVLAGRGPFAHNARIRRREPRPPGPQRRHRTPTTPGGDVRQKKPFVYQEVDGRRAQVAARYVLKGKHKVGFQIARYDRGHKLVIDPVLDYSSYLGVDGYGNDMAMDRAGDIYIVGTTEANDLPVTEGAFAPRRTSKCFLHEWSPGSRLW